jgi:hypothetical protein
MSGHRFHLNLLPIVCLLAIGCQPAEEPQPTMNQSAESFVKLVLAVGEHDADYVDAYFGPQEWRDAVREEALSLDEIRLRASELAQQLEKVELPPGDTISEHRHANLARTVESLVARIDYLSGVRMKFDEESQALFDAVAPTHTADYFQAILDQLEAALPGDEPLGQRYEAFKANFLIPPERLDAVFQAAIEACREQTRQFIELPAEESFVVEYVTDKSWSGYNWYQGDYHSLIQVNTDLPIYIDRALDLACHEGYPGHHVYNLLLEKNLLRQRDWVEYSVYPLFSPRSLISEGTANFGIEVAFPAAERLRLDSEVLYPLAGIDPERAAEYYEIAELFQQLSYAGNEAARRFLDGEIDAEEAVDWLETYALMPSARARQRLAFIEQYRSYVINYNLGKDLVRNHIERLGGTDAEPELRWQLFTDLLSNPYLPSQLR